MNVNILLVSTLNYINHLIPIVNSINNNIKIEYNIYIYLVDVYDQNEIDKIKNMSKNIIIRKLDVNLDNSKRDKSKKTKLESYSANIRIHIINELLEEGIDNILYLDVDSIVREDISELIQNIKNYDLGLFTIVERKEIQIKSGIILVRNTINSKIFFKKTESYLNKFGLYSWGSDQASLKKIYHEVIKNTYAEKEKPKILKIDTKYLDWNFLDSSIIWTGKGPRKYKDNKYLNDKKIYE